MFQELFPLKPSAKGFLHERFQKYGQEGPKLFERFVRKVLKELHPEWSRTFTRVLPWGEWARERGLASKDTGIDLVGVEETGEAWGIQVKLWDEPLGWKALGTFVGSLDLYGFKGGLLVAPSGVTTEAENKLSGLPRRVVVLKEEDLLAGLDPDSLDPENLEALKKKEPRALRPYQEEALEKIQEKLKAGGRGKLIMPPGTGKTLVALRAIEALVSPGEVAVFFAPSIALLDQTLRAFEENALKPLRYLAVVSDQGVGRTDEDTLSKLSLLHIPPTTRAEELASALKEIRARHPEEIVVLLSTYQSSEVLEQAQKAHGVGPFALMVMDEAHRTAVAGLRGQESPFAAVHKDERIRAHRRLYMTATPRVYEVRGGGNGEAASGRRRGALLAPPQEEVQVEIFSMDNEEVYGPTLFEYTFAEAVRAGYLSDYKVIVFGIPEEAQEKLSHYLLRAQALPVEETLKAIGLWRVLQGHVEGEEVDFKRVIVFNPSIRKSKDLEAELVKVAQAAREAGLFPEEDPKGVEIRHIDGSHSAYNRRMLLGWLAEEEPDTVHVLTNAKVLTEGIDVPALDGVVFMHPRDSVVDVIQAVGRAMRKAPGKTYGYVILPVIVRGKDEGAELERAGYRTVWQVLSALRAVDKTFDARTRAVLVRGASGEGEGQRESGDTVRVDVQGSSPLLFDGLLEREELRAIVPVIKGKLVKRLGLGERYLEDWAEEVAKIAERLQGVLRGAIREHPEARKGMEALLQALRQVVNEEIGEEEALLMLVQHLLTGPVFDALFGELRQARKDPVTEALDGLWQTFEGLVARETEALQSFYEGVRLKAQGLTDRGERVDFLRRLYDTFFKKAFSRVADQMGIAYTPVELVDYLVRSADELLKKHFGRGLEGEGVYVLEPFAGTGTFLVRLLHHLGAEGTRAKLERGEVFGNEILLLPYHVMRANVEAEALDLTGEYRPFEGALLADSFRLAEYAYEKGGLPQIPLFPETYSDRIKRQVESPIQVVLSNPPWRAWAEREGQGRNARYPKIRKRIEETYVRRFWELLPPGESRQGKLLNSLYDLYIHALRMATDRVEEGVVALVTNNGWLAGKAARGLRASLVEEFAEVYVYDLRGDARTKGEERRNEGGNPFGNLTRSGICLLLLVKRKDHQERGKVFLYRVRDRLSAEAKLKEVEERGSVLGTPWREVPLEEWLGQASGAWEQMVPAEKVFEVRSGGVKTNRDAYTFNPSRAELERHMRRFIATYEAYLERVKRGEITEKNLEEKIENDKTDKKDESLIKWDGFLKADLLRGKAEAYERERIYRSNYRPFVPLWLYFSELFNNSVYQTPRMWPTPEVENVAIGVSQGTAQGSIALATKVVVSLDFVTRTQLFPLYVYEPAFTLGDASNPTLEKRSNIKAEALKLFKERYGDVSPEDLFAFVYAVLSHPLYAETFAEDLKQGGLPRLPLPGAPEDFRALVEAGKKLLKLHAEYEGLDPYPLVEEVDPKAPEDPYDRYRVERMRLDREKGTLQYNEWVELKGIPQEAFLWQPGGYDPLTWIVRYFKVEEKVPQGKGPAIVWDPNKLLREEGNPRWLLEHIGRAVRAAVETVGVFREVEPTLSRVFGTLGEGA
ncbi:type ISP restriction/modification enzyme [Thermus oshimai]|uniref:type ISP restriction/modification enzyme n=1 Tax=Thermus oshimai TaxID=56957 RepID=UPI00037D1DB3|nr:type ISP restriction/modification enzyme [Thermus oshimai]